MTDARERDRFSLKRWSDRKLAAARAPSTPEAAAAGPSATPGAAAASGPGPAPSMPAPATSQAVEAAALPPVESLTFDADFTAFMKPDVEPSLKRAALKKPFADPRLNVMDGLDAYIDDYSKPDPIDAETVRGLVQARYLFDPPKTRINERGEVEDLPPEEPASASGPEPLPQDAPAIAQASEAPVPSDDVAPPNTVVATVDESGGRGGDR